MIENLGKYKILGRIGRGGMGSVYKAYDPVLHRNVALKVITAESDLTDELRTRFFLEAQACARLTHPNIVTIYDLGEADGYLFIVMELLEGEELRQLIAKKTCTDLRDKLGLMVQLCDGLDYAHQKGIVHRDIKPANIFVLPDRHLKILDFGIARIATTSSAPLTRAGLLIGTLQYMAPERVRQHGDHRADIFSVGAVLYELLTYGPPFAGDDPIEILDRLRSQDPQPPSEIDPEIMPELDQIVARALEKDPDRRYESLSKMRAALQTIHRQLAETADRARKELQARMGEVGDLRKTLAARIGGDWTDAATVVVQIVDETTPVAVLEAMQRETTTKITELRALLARADAVQPDFERGLAALERSDWDTAESALVGVTTEMPEHARATSALTQVREGREEARREEARRQEAQRRQELTSLLAEARQSHDARTYPQSLELLELLIAETPPPDLLREAEALRQTVTAAVAKAAEEAEVLRQQRLLEARAFELEQLSEVETAAPSSAAPPPSAVPPATAASLPPAVPLSSAAAVSPTPVEPAPAPPPPAPPVSVGAPSRLSRRREEVPATVAATPKTLPGPRVQPSLMKSTRVRVAAALSLLIVIGIVVAVVARARVAEQNARAAHETEARDAHLRDIDRALVAARERAVAADAPKLASSAFAAAEAQATETRRAVAAGNVASADQSQRQAIESYATAERQAASTREERTAADTAREAMLSAKRDAEQRGGDATAAREQERKGDDLYGRLAFKEAAAGFRLATDGYARVKAPAPPVQAAPAQPAPADPRAEIRTVLNNYARAIESKDVTLLQRVRPTLRDDELNRWKRSFEITRSRKVDLRVLDITVTGAEAQATGRREDTTILHDGQRVSNETRFVAMLRRQGQGWVIQDLRETRESAPAQGR